MDKYLKDVIKINQSQYHKSLTEKGDFFLIKNKIKT